MKMTRTIVLPALICLLSVSMYSCRAKKVVAKPAPAPVAKETPPAPVKEVEPPVAQPQTSTVTKPDYNFNNIQFELNSAVLKTASFDILEKAVVEMKKEPGTRFQLNGHSSAEGSPAHNMSLSVDRANSVKSFLVNAGLDASNFSVKGFGESQPLNNNTSEDERAFNRRVEIKVAQ